jgi:hypothetical protein
MTRPCVSVLTEGRWLIREHPSDELLEKARVGEPALGFIADPELTISDEVRL